jgi:hypothetical protein
MILAFSQRSILYVEVDFGFGKAWTFFGDSPVLAD